MDKPRAPWTPDQVDSLALRQLCGHFHEYTGYVGEDKYTLVPSEDGWLANGQLVQDWAHEFDTNWDWLRSWRTGLEAGFFAETTEKKFKEFKDLAGIAKAKTCFSSRAGEFLEVEEGQKILKFGLEGFLFALRLMQELGGWWTDYLYQFLPNGPHIPEDSMGRYDDIIRIHVQWAYERGFLDTANCPDNETAYFEWIHKHQEDVFRERANQED